jgi:hypothetical protein
MEVLRRDFVNAWVLAKHLPALAKEAQDPRVRAVAARAHANYLYPVDSQIFSPDGELLDHVCANDLHGPDHQGDEVLRYFELLEAPHRVQPSVPATEEEPPR